MSTRILFHPIFLALTATLLIAGLFYLPYLAVRSKTIDTFRSQQIMLARQTATDLHHQFATFEKALHTLSQEPSIQQRNDRGGALLQDFYTSHGEEIDAILRLDNDGNPLFTHPHGFDPVAATQCTQSGQQNLLALSDPRPSDGAAAQVVLATRVTREGLAAGCLAFTLPAHHMAQLALGRVPLPRDSQALVLSQNGRILHAPVPQLVGAGVQGLHGISEERGLLQEAVEHAENALLRLSQSPLQEATSQATYAVLYPVLLPGGTTW